MPLSFVKNPAINLIISYLRKQHENKEIALYVDLEKISKGCTINGIRRHELERAREKLKNDGFLFECINSVGLKPMYDNEAVTVINKKRSRKIESQVKRFSTDWDCIDYSELSSENKQNYCLGSSKLALFKIVTHDSIETKIIKHVNNSTTKTIDFANIALKALKDIS